MTILDDYSFLLLEEYMSRLEMVEPPPVILEESAFQKMFIASVTLLCLVTRV